MLEKLRFILLFYFCVLLVGCTKNVVEEDPSNNLGEINNSKITYNIYHSRNENDTWEKIASLSCEQIDDRFCAIEITGTKNEVIIRVEEHYDVTSNDGTIMKSTNKVDSFEYTVDGFDGDAFEFPFGIFDIQDIEDEQLYRIYSISNEYGAFFPNISLDSPYDLYHENFDNILLTIQIQHYAR